MSQFARAKGWLRSMTEQGEDRIWRGATDALRYVEWLQATKDKLFDALLELNEAVRLEADGEMGVSRQLGEAQEDAQRILERVTEANAVKSDPQL